MIIKWNGLLSSYKQYSSLVDQRIKKDSRHTANVNRVLKFLAMNGDATTWELRNCFPNYNDHQGESMARRIINGREDRNRLSEGLKGLSLVEIAQKNRKTGTKKYKLTIHGLLYSICECNYTTKDWFNITKNDEDLIPWIFKKSDYLNLKKISLKLLGSISRGDLARMDHMRNVALPYHELNDFLMLKSSFRKLSDIELAEFVSLWFYTFQLYIFWNENHKTAFPRWRSLMDDDFELKKWYLRFVKESIIFQEKRYSLMIRSLKTLN